VPIRNILVSDARCNIKHDDCTLTLDADQ
jgi:hypothetical protein